MNKTIVQLIIGMALGGIVLFLVVFVLQNTLFKDENPTQSAVAPLPTAVPNIRHIAKVGAEYLYESDLNKEMATYPPQPGVDSRAILLKKIVRDSIILQAAHAEGIIQLDGTVFNSLQKDYAKRIKLVEEVNQKVEARKSTTNGSIISVWFFNGRPGAVGYERGREIAFAKISVLHKAVQSKQMTMQQAADAIVRDTSLSQVDLSYKVNAIFSFKADKNEQISLDPVFDAKIRSMKAGDVSDIHLAKSTNFSTKEKVDSLYMFAQVTENNGNGTTVGFEEWLSQKEKNYEVTY